MNYYSLYGPNDRSLAVLHYQRGTEPTLNRTLAKSAEVELHLVAGPGRLVDYPPNDLIEAVGLYSPLMRSILEPFTRDFVWVLAVAKREDAECRYFALVADRVPDVLDEFATRRNPNTGSVIKPVLSRQKVDGLHLFVYSEFCPTPICSEVVRRLLLKHRVSGVRFGKRPVTPN